LLFVVVVVVVVYIMSVTQRSPLHDGSLSSRWYILAGSWRRPHWSCTSLLSDCCRQDVSDLLETWQLRYEWQSINLDLL